MTKTAIYLLLVCWSVAPSTAFAQNSSRGVDNSCLEIDKPEDYNETMQGAFMMNYFALMSGYGGRRGPIPHHPGTGSIGAEASLFPGLSCARRFAQGHQKTEDTNLSPALPLLVASYAFPRLGDRVVAFAGVGALPSLPFRGSTSTVISAEFGVGIPIGEPADPKLTIGMRLHMSSMRAIGDVALAPYKVTPNTQGSPEPLSSAYRDLFVATTRGAELTVGRELITFDELLDVEGFLAVGFVDVDTHFWIGDDDVMSDNLYPYRGLDLAIGVEGQIGRRFNVGASLSAAPGGASRPTTMPKQRFGSTGHLYTARLRFAYTLRTREQ